MQTEAYLLIVNTEADNEVEALGALKRACVAIRGGPRAELAAHVILWETQLDTRLRALGVDPADLHRSPTRRVMRRRKAVSPASAPQPAEVAS